MHTNTLFVVFIMSLSVDVSVAIVLRKKGRIVTPEFGGGEIHPSNPNYNLWPVPFFNQSGVLPIEQSPANFPVTPPPAFTAGTQTPRENINKANTIIPSPAPNDAIGSAPSTPLAPLVTIINPEMMLNYSTGSPKVVEDAPPKQLDIEPLITYLDPQYFLNYSKTTTTDTSSSAAPLVPSSTASSKQSDATTTSTPAPFTSNPIETSTFSKIKPLLGLDCTTPSAQISSGHFSNAQGLSSPGNFQVDVPANLKFHVNITSSPNYFVNIYPVTNTESDVIEINSNHAPYQPITTSNNINLDNSYGTVNAGISTATIPTPYTTSAAMMRISEEKCNEYYNAASTRSSRDNHVQVFIIGGQSSEQKEFPHMAALGYGAKSDSNNNWLCGGSLISDLYVITAAHCLSSKSLGLVSYVRLGTTVLQTETLNSEDYNIVNRITHPEYVKGSKYNDVALLELDRRVVFNEYISPICLYTSPALYSTSLTATGWGKTSEDGHASKDLQKVNLNYIPIDACQRAYSIVPKDQLPFGIQDVSQLCAGTPNGEGDTCQGDSGGPLQLKSNGRMFLVGITSFGIGCGTPQIPGVYTKVSYYVPWIEQIVWRR
ncbi:unnamed protein product [Phyllotreta striolata]|uniref:Peptidase S1 domain-containing protein n=1 Tax=Phyllotreta striolata TaxID=444603 RepID=A0A9N9TZP5_PHYSR|nr:unnamed protein product [Phyllotreta striolata]